MPFSLAIRDQFLGKVLKERILSSLLLSKYWNFIVTKKGIKINFSWECFFPLLKMFHAFKNTGRNNFHGKTFYPTLLSIQQLRNNLHIFIE